MEVYWYFMGNQNRLHAKYSPINEGNQFSSELPLCNQRIACIKKDPVNKDEYPLTMVCGNCLRVIEIRKEKEKLAVY